MPAALKQWILIGAENNTSIFRHFTFKLLTFMKVYSLTFTKYINFSPFPSGRIEKHKICEKLFSFDNKNILY